MLHITLLCYCIRPCVEILLFVAFVPLSSVNAAAALFEVSVLLFDFLMSLLLLLSLSSSLLLWLVLV